MEVSVDVPHSLPVHQDQQLQVVTQILQDLLVVLQTGMVVTEEQHQMVVQVGLVIGFLVPLPF